MTANTVMFIVSQAHCLKLYLAGNGPVHTRKNFVTSNFIHTTGRHVRALIYLPRRSRALTLGIAMIGGSAITAFMGQHVVNRMEIAAGAAPLVPAPAAPLAPPASSKKHHFLSSPLQGLASWYGSMWNGRPTASGEAYDESQLTAAHKSLPLGTLVRVTNLASTRSVIVRINDRGALSPNRVIDLSSAAAREIGMLGQGLAKVKLEVIGKL